MLKYEIRFYPTLDHWRAGLDAGFHGLSVVCGNIIGPGPTGNFIGKISSYDETLFDLFNGEIERAKQVAR